MMTARFKFYTQLSVLFGFWLLSQVLYAEIATSIYPQKGYIEDTFKLTFTIHDASTNGVLDISKLQTDFYIVSTSKNSRYFSMNGQVEAYTDWIIYLKPKHAGSIQIPAFQIGQSSSKPLTVTVKTTQKAIKQRLINQQNSVFIKTEISTNKPYIHQKVDYFVKLYTSLSLIDAQYSMPDIKDALVLTLGETKRYQEMVNDKLYAVEEQHLALYPQKSGSLVISPPTFEYIEQGFNPKHGEAKGDKKTLQVLPIPKDFSGKNWLPSNQVKLKAEPHLLTQKLKTGEVLERTITLSAADIPAQLLPDIVIPQQKNYQVYQENIDEKNTFKQSLVGQKTIKATYLFNKAGVMTIPAIEVDWFDLKTKQLKKASIPETTIKIYDTLKKNHKNANHPQDAKTPEVNSIKKTRAGFVPLDTYLILMGAIVLMLVIICYVIAKKRSKKSSLTYKAFTTALNQNDLHFVRRYLLTWAGRQWTCDTFLSIEDIMQKLPTDSELHQALSHLNQALFAKKVLSKTDKLKLVQALKQYRPCAQKKIISSIPPLNPK